MQVGGLGEVRLSRRKNDRPPAFGRESRTENASTARSERLDCRRRLVGRARSIVLRLRRLLLIGTGADKRPSDGFFTEVLPGHSDAIRLRATDGDKMLATSGNRCCRSQGTSSDRIPPDRRARFSGNPGGARRTCAAACLRCSPRQNRAPRRKPGSWTLADTRRAPGEAARAPEGAPGRPAPPR
jgi:hypothetical protein